MMKKILFIIGAFCFACNLAFANAPKPTKKIVLFYRVPNAILQCQNSKEDMIAGKEELEKELRNHYGKRFIVEEIRQLPYEDFNTTAEFLEMVKINQTPFILKISLEGQGTSVDYYQNTYGATKTGVAPTTNVHLFEAIIDSKDNELYAHDYGIKSYTAGTFALGRDIFSQKDPRINTKNAVRGCFRDACTFNQSINKYANPAAYELETDRFTGNFKPLAVAAHKMLAEQNAKLEKFKQWCNSDSSRSNYLVALNNIPTFQQKIAFIDYWESTGLYKE